MRIEVLSVKEYVGVLEKIVETEKATGDRRLAGTASNLELGVMLRVGPIVIVRKEVMEHTFDAIRESLGLPKKAKDTNMLRAAVVGVAGFGFTLCLVLLAIVLPSTWLLTLLAVFLALAVGSSWLYVRILARRVPETRLRNEQNEEDLQ